MRTVYRYEDSLGRGPYHSWLWRNQNALSRLLNNHCGDDAHLAWGSLVFPEYAEPRYEIEIPDDEVSVSGDWLAACDSRESLDDWFEGYAETLAENGFTLREYTVPDENVIDSYSGRQCAFLPVND